MRSTGLKACGLSLVVAAAAPASGQVIFDTFGPLPEATFGGTGIPNGEVAQSKQFTDGDNIITVALSATQRFSNPPLTNDGAATYFATPGSNFGDPANPTTPSPSATEGATWNFNFYAKVESPTSSPQITDYQFDLLYDLDPGANTPLVDFGKINLTNSVAFSPDPTTDLIEDSQNAFFAFLTTSLPGFVDPPPTSFDPDVDGEYGFVIQVSNLAGFNVENVAITVVVPEPASAMLLGLGTLAMLRRSRSI